MHSAWPPYKHHCARPHAATALHFLYAACMRVCHECTATAWISWGQGGELPAGIAKYSGSRYFTAPCMVHGAHELPHTAYTALRICMQGICSTVEGGDQGKGETIYEIRSTCTLYSHVHRLFFFKFLVFWLTRC